MAPAGRAERQRRRTGGCDDQGPAGRAPSRRGHRDHAAARRRRAPGDGPRRRLRIQRQALPLALRDRGRSPAHRGTGSCSSSAARAAPRTAPRSVPNEEREERRAQGDRTKRCAIYTRKSTSAGLEQDFNSLDAQRDACEAYIRAKRDGRSIPSVRRRRLHRREHRSTRVHPADRRTSRPARSTHRRLQGRRLSRSLLDFAKMMERFTRRAAFVSVTQNFSTADAMGRLTLNMLMSFAEFETRNDRRADARQDRGSRRKGKWTGGRIPLGYGRGERLVVDELEASPSARSSRHTSSTARHWGSRVS